MRGFRWCYKAQNNILANPKFFRGTKAITPTTGMSFQDFDGMDETSYLFCLSVRFWSVCQYVYGTIEGQNSEGMDGT
jgi:hypothetical protein